MVSVFEYQCEDGDTIYVETDDLVSNYEANPASSEGLTKRASETFENALSVIRPAALAIRKSLSTIGPSEMTVEFGIKMSAEVGALIAKSNAESNFKVSVKWAPE